ncbi:MAG: phosphatase PAP2 family protein [Polyangiales bacterium]
MPWNQWRSHTLGASRWLLAPERRWLLLLAFAAAGLATFMELADEIVDDDDLLAFDRGVLTYLRGWRTPMLTMRAVDLTAIGSVTVLSLVSLCTFVGLLRLGDRRGALQFVLTMVGVMLWTFLTKTWFARERPEMAHRLLEVSGYSFPSGHSSGTSALMVGMAMVFMPHLRTLANRVWLLSSCCAFALLIGFTRMYLGVHYPSDVASGLAFGSSWALLIAALFEWLRPRWAEPRPPDEDPAPRTGAETLPR